MSAPVMPEMDPGAPQEQQQGEQQTQSLAQQMAAEGSLPDMPERSNVIPMRAVVAAASTMNPDQEAKTQQLAQQAGMGVDLTRSNPQAAQQRAVVSDLDRRQIEIANPILAHQLADPGFAGVAHDDLDSLTQIDRGAAEMRAWTPNWKQRADEALQRAFTFMGGSGSLEQNVFEYPLARMAIGTVRGSEEMLGNVGSFVGIHGAISGPNALQRASRSLDPESFGVQPTGLDTVASQIGPMIPAVVASGGTSLLARTLGMSETAAKVLGAMGLGSMFSADQAGGTFTRMAGAGRTDEQARHAADLTFGVTLPFNTAAGLTDLAPFLNRFPLLASLAAGAGMGASSRLASNVATGQPWSEGVASDALQGAAVQGGMHVGFGAVDALGENREQNQIAALAQQLQGEASGNFRQSMSNTIDAVEASKVRARSPELFQGFLDGQFVGNPSLRIPAQDFVSYFHGKGVDPAAVASDLGVKNLEEASAAGSDLEIPKANFFARLDPPHQRGLLPDVVDPATEMTARQVSAGRQELEDWVAGGGPEKLQADYAQADAETQATPEWQKVYSDLKQRYVDAGQTDTAADNYATLQANALSNLAKGAGLKPDELLALHNPRIVEGEAPATVLHQEPVEGDDEAEPAEPTSGADRRKARNLEAARVQGELLKGGAEPAAPEAAAAAAPETPRGWFRVLPDGRYEIGKTKLGDFSTFLHEPAHAYLEFFRELTQRDATSPRLADDFKKITEWLGTTPEEAWKNGFTREQHEQWARANEQYLREGNAPTSGLARAFHHFATWLQTIYKRASDLGVEMSSEIRGVMDRLYAGDSAVDRAEREREAGTRQLFQNPEEAGWTEAEFRNYAEAKGIALDQAREQVRAELAAAADRDRTEKFQEEKGNVRDAVTAEIDARPEYRAIRALRKGELEDGTAMTLNRDALVEQFGEDRVRALQKVHRGLYRNEGGTDAETASEILGFRSGEEMMRALESAPRRSVAIDEATRNFLTNKYGDVRYDGTLNDRARFAIENDERAGNIYREMRALRARLALVEKKAADAKSAMASITIEPLEHYQEAARQMIDQKAIADLQPTRYLNASRKYSRDAFDALRKGNVKSAAEAKNKELLNHFLFREASAARDYADKFEKYVQRVQSKGIQQRMGLAGSDYRDQFNWLMTRYRLGAANATQPERSLREWADDVYGQGNEVAIAPGILNEGRFVDYRNAPLSEVRDLHDALVNIRHLAQREFQMYVQGKQVKFAEARAAMVNAARENLKVKPEAIFEENLSRGNKFLRGLQWVDSRLIRMERLVEWLDGGKAGPWHDNLWNLASDAQGDEYKLQEQVTQRVTDALADMPAEMRRRLWTEKETVEGIPEPLTRRRMLSMAFNMGNEGNLDRLRKTFTSFGWDPDAIQKIGGMLTREEWGFVQKAWDSLKPMGERMQELEKRLTGLPPQMVKVTPFKVALDDGTEMDLEGGYFPIVMDPRFSQRAIEQDARETAQNAMQSGYVRATTAKGYTKERTGFGGPLLLDYEQVLTSHVAKVAKDLSHREFMLASQRFLLDTEVRKTLRETLGPAYEQQFMPWLRTIINDNNGSVQEGLDGLKAGMQKLRGNIVAASLGFNTSTSLLQISHAPRMLLYAKPMSLAQSFVDLLARPIEASREVRELSPNEMRFRGDNLDRDIRAVLQKPDYQSGYTRKVAVAARFSLEVMDHLLSHTLWKAAYRDALDKYDELPIGEAQEKAAHEADSAVRLGLGTSAPKDLPAIMRSNEFNKFITTLYGFHNGVYNQLRDIGHQLRYEHNVGKATYAGILTVVLPAVLGSWLTGQRPKDDENPGWWAAKRALLFSADTVPILRSVASAMEGGHDVQFSPVENVMLKGAKAAMDAASTKDNKDWAGIGLNAAEAGGEIAGVPGSHQAVKTLRYVKRASEGKVQDPNVWNALVGGGR